MVKDAVFSTWEHSEYYLVGGIKVGLLKFIGVNKINQEGQVKYESKQ